MLHEVGLWRKANKITKCQISNVKCKKHKKRRKWVITTLGFAAYFASANSFLWCLNISIRELLLFLTNYVRSRMNCPSHCEALFQLDYFYLNSNCFPPVFVKDGFNSLVFLFVLQDVPRLLPYESWGRLQPPPQHEPGIG